MDLQKLHKQIEEAATIKGIESGPMQISVNMKDGKLESLVIDEILEEANQIQMRSEW